MTLLWNDDGNSFWCTECNRAIERRHSLYPTHDCEAEQHMAPNSVEDLVYWKLNGRCNSQREYHGVLSQCRLTPNHEGLHEGFSSAGAVQWSDADTDEWGRTN